MSDFKIVQSKSKKKQQKSKKLVKLDSNRDNSQVEVDIEKLVQWVQP